MSLPLAAADTVWRVLARVRGADAANLTLSLLDNVARAVSAFEIASEEWHLEAYPRSSVLTPALAARIALTAASSGGALLEISEEKLPARDWVAENQLAFPPLRIGRFFVYGSHHRGGVPAGTIGVAIDAATAFGTGEHPSTRGCLMALERLARRHRFHRPLDIGTGTGILSIAAAKLLRRKILASDFDAGAVKVARHNVACNEVTRLVQVRNGPGYRDRVMRKSRYDLILSNILARPLAVFAPELARTLAPGGRAVLSGLLRRQEAIVLVPHRGYGVVLEHRIVVDGWSTLVLRSRWYSEMAMGADAPIFELDPVDEPLRLPSVGRISPGSGTAWPARAGRTRRNPRQRPRFANGEFRYRQASDRRAPSVRRKPAAGAASLKRLSRSK